MIITRRVSSPAGSTKSARRKQLAKKLLIWGAAAFVALILLGALAFSILMAWVSRDLPDPNSLISQPVAQTTSIYDRTGTHLLYQIHGDQNRTLVQISDLPSYVPHATVAIEDKGFYTENGIDWLGLVRAIVMSVLKGHRIEGTSTITQQLVRNSIITNERTLTRKVKEMLLSLQIERVYTKDQILQLYLNAVPYGSTTYGIESASEAYFGKHAKDLTIDEAALLAAIPQAPDIYSPYGTGSHGDNRTALVARQHLVIDDMAAQGYITQDQANAAKQVDTLSKLVPQKLNNIEAPHFVMYVKSLLEDQYGDSEVETGGLKVITTLDWDKQQIAENAVSSTVNKLGPKYNFTNGALVALDPKTGQILSMVGSKDFFDASIDGQVNVALAPRQPGSSFKPIVYAASFIKGYTPDTTLWDVDTTFKTDSGPDYKPLDYDLKERGPVSVRMALQGSLNIPAVEMLYLVGVDRVLDFAQTLGYTTFSDRSRFGLSLVLGGGEVTLLEHTDAYSAFANNGLEMPTSAILEVDDAKGNVLQKWQPNPGTQVMDPSITGWISNILSDNAARAYVFGLHNSLTLPDRPVAAKTGTTNNFHDAWTMGYTPSLAAGVWVGNNDNAAMKTGSDGSLVAAPIWQAFMEGALKGTPVETFPAPVANTATKPVLLGTDYQFNLPIDSETGLLATSSTPANLIVQKQFRQAHSTLYYVDKDDPTGPQPTDPTVDPQFANWESAVQDWVTRTNWYATTTQPPTQSDANGGTASFSASITSPASGATLTSRTGTVSVNITGTGSIARVEVMSEGQLIGSSTQAPWNVSYQFPNNFGAGSHDLTASAIDTDGNRSTNNITINLQAPPANVPASIVTPQSGSTLSAGHFPVTIAVSLTNPSTVSKLDVYQQLPDGSTHPVASTTSITGNVATLEWTSPPAPGTYTLLPVVTDSTGNSLSGQTVSVTVGQ